MQTTQQNEPERNQWEAVGWIGRNASGKSYSVVSGAEGKGIKIGIVTRYAIERLLSGATRGAAIKVPPEAKL